MSDTRTTLAKPAVVKPAFLSSMTQEGESSGSGGGANRKPLWDCGEGKTGVSAKRLCHALAGLFWHVTGQVVLWDNLTSRKGAYCLSYEQVRKCLATLHPVLNGDPKKSTSAVPKGTLKGTWIKHGRLYRGGTPAKPGLHAETWTEERKARVLSVACKVIGADPKSIAPSA